MSFRDLPSKLNLGKMPVYSQCQACDPERSGSFLHQYMPEKHVVDISPRHSQARKAFGAQLAG